MYKKERTSCPNIRVHISVPVSSPMAMTATANAAIACFDINSFLVSLLSSFLSVSFSFFSSFFSSF